jgi:hypothetical protein
MLGLGKGTVTVKKATEAAVVASAALKDAEARREVARAKLAEAPVEKLEPLADEAARAEALVSALKARVEAAEARRVEAEAAALEAALQAEEKAAEEAYHRVRAAGDRFAMRVREVVEELLAEARAMDELAAEGRRYKFALPVGERQDAAYDPVNASPWVGCGRFPPNHFLRRLAAGYDAGEFRK